MYTHLRYIEKNCLQHFPYQCEDLDLGEPPVAVKSVSELHVMCGDHNTLGVGNWGYLGVLWFLHHTTSPCFIVFNDSHLLERRSSYMVL
jgi:hypothetical protein